MTEKRAGSLARANKLIAGDLKTSGKSVFTLDQWAGSRPSSSQDAISHSKRRSIDGHRKARLLLIKAQETALDFLIRWLLVDDSSNRLESVREESTQETSKVSRTRKRRKLKSDRTKLLINSISALPDKRFWPLIKFLFWRWLTWANIIELLLIQSLIFCCMYQCYDLLTDYFRYPTYVTVTKVMNDDFRMAIPAVTLCNRNKISRSALKRNYPHLNDSHYLAMTLGTFKSVNDFTLPQIKDQRLVGADTDNMTDYTDNRDELEFDWLAVVHQLTNDTPDKFGELLPEYELPVSVTCANIWGIQMPCAGFHRIRSIQNGHVCDTMFHDSAFYDPSDAAVQKLNQALKSTPSQLVFGTNTQGLSDKVDLIELHDEDGEGNKYAQGTGVNVQRAKRSISSQRTPHADLLEAEERLNVELANMEMIRLRFNFRLDDYRDEKAPVGAYFVIHPSSIIGSMRHTAHRVEPGFWHNYYIERTDYKRLPPPYNTQCYDYESNRYQWRKLRKWALENRNLINRLMREQAAKPGEPLREYVENVRARSVSGSECKFKCELELPVIKCNCWPRGQPYVRGNSIDLNGTIRYCDLSTLMKMENASEVAADDLYFQLCAKDFSLTCLAACPNECSFSSFEVTEQKRPWPSLEIRRYQSDKRLLASLKKEAECCATISVIYAAPASSFHTTEPKYSRQDMITIVSGNIEAWIGLSAVHVYLFLERLYDALVEAKLITPLSNWSFNG